MSCSKPLQPFVCDSLYYLNRGQLERFSIVCRPLKNFIERYLHSKPYRAFDQLLIREGMYALFHNDVQWHPNRDDYIVQQFLATQKCSIDESKSECDDNEYYSFAEMRPYLGSAIRIMELTIVVTEDYTYSHEYIAEMESIAYLWRGRNIIIHANHPWSQIGAEDLHLVLSSPTILQCQLLEMINVHFPFKDYEILYAVKLIKIIHQLIISSDEIDLWHQYWQQFLEQPGDKPIVCFVFLSFSSNNLLDRLSKAFSSAVTPNAFKILFAQEEKLSKEPLTELRKTNYTSREKLELKKGIPAEYENVFSAEWDTEFVDSQFGYTLERSII